MNKKILFFALLSAIALPFCSTSKKSVSDTKMTEPKISYVTDIATILEERCTPCHFPNGGKMKFLDTYASVSDNIDDIICRIELPIDSSRFMPFKSKKEPLSDSLVQVFKMWKAHNLPK